MIDITQMEIDEPIDIWKYVFELTDSKIVDQNVYESQLVEFVYRNNTKTFDHLLLPPNSENVYMVIVVDLKKNEIFGHKELNLNKKYGLK